MEAKAYSKDECLEPITHVWVDGKIYPVTAWQDGVATYEYDYFGESAVFVFLCRSKADIKRSDFARRQLSGKTVAMRPAGVCGLTQSVAQSLLAAIADYDARIVPIETLRQWTAQPDLMPVGRRIFVEAGGQSTTIIRVSESEWKVIHSYLQEESMSDDPLSLTCTCPFSGKQHHHGEKLYGDPAQAAKAYVEAR